MTFFLFLHSEQKEGKNYKTVCAVKSAQNKASTAWCKNPLWQPTTHYNPPLPTTTHYKFFSFQMSHKNGDWTFLHDCQYWANSLKLTPLTVHLKSALYEGSWLEQTLHTWSYSQWTGCSIGCEVHCIHPTK